MSEISEMYRVSGQILEPYEANHFRGLVNFPINVGIWLKSGYLYGHVNKALNAIHMSVQCTKVLARYRTSMEQLLQEVE